MFSKETMAKVAEFAHAQRKAGLVGELLRQRMDNYRRTLELDPKNYKRKKIPEAREVASERLGFPIIAHNVRRGERLERRLRDFNAMSAIQQASMTRPGSMKS